MDIEQISKEIKENPDKYSVETIENLFIQFGELVLTEHLKDKNKSDEVQELIKNRLENGYDPRPVLAIYVGIKNINPTDVSNYINDMSNNLERIVSPMEYLTLIVPVQREHVSIEVLSPNLMEEKTKVEFFKKIDSLKKIIHKYLKNAQ